MTDALANYVANEPSPIMLLLPTEADARDYVVSDLEPTAGCDVQDDRIEVSLIGWTKTGEILVLAHLIVWGSPDDTTTWAELDALLRTRWQHPHGGSLRIDAAVIDSGDGDWTQAVYNFCFPRLGRRILAGKGMAGARPVLQASKTKIKGAGRLFLVGVDVVKSTLLSRLVRGRSIRFSS